MATKQGSWDEKRNLGRTQRKNKSVPGWEGTLPAAQTTYLCVIILQAKFKELAIVCWGLKVTTSKTAQRGKIVACKMKI